MYYKQLANGVHVDPVNSRVDFDYIINCQYFKVNMEQPELIVQSKFTTIELLCKYLVANKLKKISIFHI